MKVFGERLKKLRQSKNMTQAELGSIFDPPLAQSTIGTYENGVREMSYNNLLKVAEFFNVSIDYLLGRTEEPRTETKTINNNPLELREFLNQKQVLFNGLELTEEDKKRMTDILTGLFWEHFTNKK